MNKQTLPVVIACLLALFGVQYVVNKVYPPIPRKPRPAAVAPSATGSVISSPDVATIQAVPAPAPAPVSTNARPAEQIAILSNDFVRIEITSWGGGVKSVELRKQKEVLRGPALTLPGNAVFTITQPDARTVVLHGDEIGRAHV